MSSAPPPPAYNQAAGYNTAPGYPPPQGYGGYPPPGGYPPQGGYPPPQGVPPGGYPPYPPPTNAAYPPPNQGGYSGPQPDIPQAEPTTNASNWQEESLTTSSFSDKAIRRAFIRKVYLILTAQLLVTVGFVAFFVFHQPTKKWVQKNSWFYWCSYAVFLVTYITLVCCSGVRKRYPGNFICLGIFTLAFSYVTATISSYYNTNIVLIAAGITAVVCLSITLFAIQTKIDFTMCSGLLFAGCMVLLAFGLISLIWYMVNPAHFRILQIVYGAIAALLFSLFLAYDTQMLMGGRKYELSPEEYISGALQLYMDIVYMFLIILSLFGSRD